MITDFEHIINHLCPGLIYLYCDGQTSATGGSIDLPSLSQCYTWKKFSLNGPMTVRVDNINETFVNVSLICLYMKDVHFYQFPPPMIHGTASSLIELTLIASQPHVLTIDIPAVKRMGSLRTLKLEGYNFAKLFFIQYLPSLRDLSIYYSYIGYIPKFPHPQTRQLKLNSVNIEHSIVVCMQQVGEIIFSIYIIFNSSIRINLIFIISTQ